MMTTASQRTGSWQPSLHWTNEDSWPGWHPKSLLWLEASSVATVMLCRYPNWFLRKNGFMGCGDTNAGGHEVQLTGDQHRDTREMS